MGMQYLIECNDKSLSVVYQRSILVNNVEASLSVGDSIQFLWPEDSPKAKQYSGVIIAKDRDENILMDLMEAKKPKRLQRKQKINSLKEQNKKDTDQESGNLDLKVNSRKRPPTIIETELLEEIKRSRHSEENKNSRINSNEFHWIADQVESLKSIIMSDLSSIQDKLFTKLDNLKTKILSIDASSSIPINKRSRSYGMPSESEIADDLTEIPSEPEIADELTEIPSEPEIADELTEIPSEPEIADDLTGMTPDTENGDRDDLNLSDVSKNCHIINKKPNTYTSNQNKVVIYSSDDDEDVGDHNGEDANQGNHENINNDVNIETNIQLTGDTAWTLRHHAAGENTLELIKGCQIFMDRFELKTASEKSRNQNELARALLRIVFTDDALRKCSMTGRKAKGQGKNNIVRPGLHAKAIDCILIYVQAQAKRFGWPAKDRQVIIKSMTSKLGEMKSATDLNLRYCTK